MLKINKSSFPEFLADVMRYNELVAPVKTDDSRFELVTDLSKLDLKLHPLFPVKKFFFKKRETLFSFENNKFSVPESRHDKKTRVLVGLKRCDLNSIKRLDIMFLKETVDAHYKEERERSILIGLHCSEQFDDFCFCNSMDIGDFYDLMLYEKEEIYLVEIGSEKGRCFVERYRKYFWDTELFLKPEDRKTNTALVLEKMDIKNLTEHEGWNKFVSRCFSCGSCVSLCPSCYCFDLYDEIDAALSKVEKKRNWAACQFQCFTKVAGRHIFREKRIERFQHRIFHQVQYFREKHGMTLCSGCGRCIRGCPTKINWVKMLNEMNKD